MINIMTNNDIKKITKVVKQELNDVLKPVNKKLDIHTKLLIDHSAKLDNHTKLLIDHSAKLDNHTKILNKHSVKLDNHTASLMNIEHTLKGYGDMYKINKEDNEKLNQRVDRIENQLTIPHLD